MKHFALRVSRAMFLAVLLPPLSANAVVVNGLDWRQLTETRNFSWNQVATVCNTTTGACAGTLGTVSFTGWTWASNDDIRSLFDALIGPGTNNFPTCYDSYGATNSADIAAAIGDPFFLPTFTSPGPFGFDLVQAWSRSTPASSTFTAYAPNLTDNFPAGAGDRAVLDSAPGRTVANPALGVWLYQSPPVSVPEPATTWLLAVGLLILIRSRRAAQPPTTTFEARAA